MLVALREHIEALIALAIVAAVSEQLDEILREVDEEIADGGDLRTLRARLVARRED